MAIKYLNFDLLVERSGAGYLAKVLESPAGESSEYFEVPFSQREVEDFFIQIGHTRSTESSEARRIHGFGQQLFEATFSGTVRDCLRASLNETAKQGAGLRVRLRLADLPELGNLPWEFMYDPSQSRFLALSVETPLVRYLETAQQIQPLTVQPPLRILTMICSPRDFPKLDTEKEWENLQEALRDLQGRGLVDLQRLDPPTLPALQRQLRREQYHIFHFIGHGVFSKANQDGYLLLETEQRQGHRLSGRDLGTLLHDHRPLRLAMLNACEGARASLEDQFSGTAQSLMQQGIPAVIAMQFRITDQASITLAHEFYGALADGYPVDAALTEARKAIKTQGNNLEWGTPVLYMRSRDGQVFDMAQMPSAAPSHLQRKPGAEAERLEKMYTEALEAYYLGRWDEAFQKFQAIVDLAPDHKDAAAKLESARHKARMQGLQDQASAAEKAADWDKAIEVLVRITQEDPSLTEAPARLAQAQRQKQLHELYTEAQRLSQAEKWQAVLEIFKEIEAIVPRHPDPQGLRIQAEKKLAQSRRIAELENAYADGLRAIDQSRWKEAVRHLRRVRGMQAGYRETDQLIKRAEAESERLRKEKKVIEEPIASSDLGKLSLAGLGLFFAARFAIELFGPLFDRWGAEYVEGAYAAQATYMFVFGALLGLSLFLLLKLAGLRPTRRELLTLVLTLAASTSALLTTALYWSNQVYAVERVVPQWVWMIMFAALGPIITALLAIILRARDSGFGVKSILVTAAGWTAAFLVGQSVMGELHTPIGFLLDDRMTKLLVFPLESGIVGLFGALVTFAQVRRLSLDRNRWITAAGAAAGFALGNFIVYMLFFDLLAFSTTTRTFAHMLWGLLIGLGLALPARDYRRYLAFGLLGGLGMYLANLVWRTASTNFYGLIMGSILGLALGLGTKKITVALALSALFGSAFVILNSLTSRFLYNYFLMTMSERLTFPLYSAAFGLLLGLAWGYLQAAPGKKGSNPQSPEAEIQV